MNDQQRRHSAAVLLIVTSVTWLHEWFPALFVAAFVLWAIVHNRLEGDLGAILLRWWRRAWPPKTLVLVPLLVAGMLVYWLSNVPTRVKILPVTLNVIALSLVVLGGWWRRRGHSGDHHADGMTSSGPPRRRPGTEASGRCSSARPRRASGWNSSNWRASRP